MTIDDERRRGVSSIYARPEPALPRSRRRREDEASLVLLSWMGMERQRQAPGGHARTALHCGRLHGVQSTAHTHTHTHEWSGVDVS